jgi:hypothetical protein
MKGNTMDMTDYPELRKNKDAVLADVRQVAG